MVDYGAPIRIARGRGGLRLIVTMEVFTLLLLIGRLFVVTPLTG
jgi:hypothetical protein